MMKRLIILSLSLASLALALDARIVRPIRPRPGQEAPGKPQKLHSDNTLIIFYDSKSGKKSLLNAIKKYGASVIYDYKNISSIAIKLPDGKNVDEAKAHFEKVEGVVQVEYDKIKRIMR